ncbi:MAG TPA: hypothetical protein VE890_02795 [Thermoguttaceae bacterium]|nr:hypothetical protein [Thermoguttaceae bacterium]
MIVVPLLVQLAFPKFPDAIVVVAVVLPIIAFFLRTYAGCCYICANHCGVWMRRFQLFTLNLGVFTLTFVDAFVMSMQGEVDWGKEDPRVFIIIYCFYIACMLVTLYPGPTDPIASPRSLADVSSFEHDWQSRYPNAMPVVDRVLTIFCEAFLLNDHHKYRLRTDDRVVEIYRTTTGPIADEMQFETLVMTFDGTFGIDLAEHLSEQTTLADLVDMVLNG